MKYTESDLPLWKVIEWLIDGRTIYIKDGILMVQDNVGDDIYDSIFMSNVNIGSSHPSFSIFRDGDCLTIRVFSGR